jgi:hypothetical protein
MIKTFYDQRPIFLAILLLLTVLAFYIKMNTGLIAMLLLSAHFINLVVCKKITLVKLLMYSISFIVLVIVSAILLYVSIFDYITGSLQIIKGYNDIMYLDEIHPNIEHSLYILFFAMLLWFLYTLWVQVREKKYNLVLYTIAGVMYIFLLLKQSVLRNDVQHLYEYFSYSPIILLCGFAGIGNKKPHLIYSLVIIMFSLFFVSEFRTIGTSLKNRVTGPIVFVKQFWEYNSLAYINQQDKRYIPQRVLNKIGNKTVDVFPWDSEYAIENRLNYKPRPVFQSFSAYTPMLEQINYDYYVKHAPDVLIYDYDSIDNRYAFNDESLINLFILNNYTLIDTFTSNERARMVLQRNNKTVPLRFMQLKKEGFSLKDTIVTNRANFIKLDIQYNLAGKIKALISSPPHVQISYMREDGEWFTYKASVELLKTGIFAGDLVINNDDYLSLLTGKHTAAIKKIKLETNGNYFKETGMADAYLVNCPQDSALRNK